jgi:prepilin-type N-terminal cleavage/methylation domain-containing protein
MIRLTRLSQTTGFTLIELVIIIVIIGILSMFAIPRFDHRGAQVVAVARRLVEDLRYAQSRAVTTQIRHGVIFSNCGGVVADCLQYQVSEFDDAGNPTVPAKDPLTQLDFVVQMANEFNDVTLDTTLPTQRVRFEPSGSPINLVDGNNTIDVKAGGHCERLTITLATGLISRGVCP